MAGERLGKFSWKFYLGITLIFGSLVMGKIDYALFLLYFDDLTVRQIIIITYILSWPMLALGIWLAGKEDFESMKKYFDYRYYHMSIKEGTKRAYDITGRKAREIKNKAMIKTKEIKQNALKKTKLLLVKKRKIP